MPRPVPASLYSLRVELQYIEPLIWRRVLVPVNIALPELHKVLQAVLGWSDSHQHCFAIGNQRYGVPDDEFPEQKIVGENGKLLNATLAGSIVEFCYEYDFGDSWEHLVVVESTVQAKPDFPHTLCIAGERACPPEDVGGPPGYEDFLGVIRNPQHDLHDRLTLWAGGFFDPEGFDLNAVNTRLNAVRV